MKEKNKHPVRMLTLALATVPCIGLTSCATTGQHEELQTRIDTVVADAAAAKAEASAATANANEAISTANEAISIANEANSRSMETESKIDRMFKKAMYK